jgi:hypothetical protein
MESNRRRYPEDDNGEHLEENQRIGRDIARERGNQNWNEQYRSGQSYHNRNEGYGPEQTHYGARPDSAYRNQNAINYGNRPEQNNNFDRNDRSYNQPNNSGRDGYNQSHNGFSNQNRNPDTNYHEQSSGERHYNRERDTWPERNEYKDDDYRYRSGNRGDWHAPDGLGNSDNDRNRNQRNYREQNNDRHNNQNQFRNQDHDRRDYRNRHQDHEQGFFDRIGNSISNTWNHLTNPNDYHPANQQRHYEGENRNNPRGYESGPRWANESEQERHERQRGDFRSDLH